MPMSVPSPPSTTIRSTIGGRSSRETVARPGGSAGERRRLGLEDRRGRRAPRASRPGRRGTRGRVAGRVLATRPTRAIDMTEPVSCSSWSRRRWSRNSRLPSVPAIGESVSPTRANPSASAAADDLVDRRVRGPPGRARCPLCRLRARPASNCGLTSATTSAPGASSGGTTGRMWRSEMNETSIVTMSNAVAGRAVGRR